MHVERYSDRPLQADGEDKGWTASPEHGGSPSERSRDDKTRLRPKWTAPLAPVIVPWHLLVCLAKVIEVHIKPATRLWAHGTSGTAGKQE